MSKKEYIDSVNGKKIFAERAGYTENGESIDEALTDLVTNVKGIVAGDNIAISNNTTSTFITATADSGPVGVCGPKGFCGPKGACGPQGSKGDTGICGPQGSKGNAGFCGPQGSKGNAGFCGPQGIGGAGGNQGATGPNGFCGPKGLTGATGATGPNGFCGPQGATGARGPCGPVGATGATGPRGNGGVTGATGARGIAPQGNQGATGPCGPHGILWGAISFARYPNFTTKTISTSWTNIDDFDIRTSPNASLVLFKFTTTNTDGFYLRVRIRDTTNNKEYVMKFFICGGYVDVNYVFFIAPGIKYYADIASLSGSGYSVTCSEEIINFTV